jgi:PAS domain S-box-containing protein
MMDSDLAPDCYQHIFDQHQTVMLIIDPATGRILHANPAAATYYGGSLDELLQKNIGEINTLSTEQVRAEMDQALSQQRNFFIFQHRLADGRVRDVEVRSTPVLWQGSQALCSMVSDVTERNATEQMLRKINLQLELVVAERTEEVSAANEELVALNEELTAQNEEIASINLTLEQRVEERTSELSAAHQELLAQYEELQAAQQQLTHQAGVQAALREIAEATIRADSLDVFYKSVHQQVRRVLNADNVYITLLDAANQQIVRPYLVDGLSNVPQTRPLGKGWTEYVMRTGKSLHITHEVLAELMRSGEVDMTIAYFHEWIGAPLVDGRGDSFGVVALFSATESQSFSPADMEVLNIIAAQISLAIQRKQSETVLQENEKKLSSLFAAMNEMVVLHEIVFDGRGKPVDYRILDCNKAFCDITGIMRQVAVGRLATELYQTTKAPYLEVYSRVVSAGQPEQFQTYYAPMNRHFLISVVATAPNQFATVTTDISNEVRREEELRRDIELAGRVQTELLKVAAPSKHLAVTTLYQPQGYVGGDLYFMDWRYEGTLLRGFLLDATGHGLSTALHTAAMHVLLREVNELDLPLTEQMRWLNRRASEYFDESSFAGAIGFEVDLQTRQLRWCCAGMPMVWLSTKTRQGLESCPGLYLGICSAEAYELHTLDLSAGDAACFMTDGFSRLIAADSQEQPVNYEQMQSLLAELAQSGERSDDATAVCIRVSSLPERSATGSGWPRIFRLNGYGDYLRYKGEIAKMLAEATGKSHSMQEVAVNEALANAMECRDGVARQHRARLRINKLGDRLVVRVHTSRIGFAGNAMLRRLRSHPEEMFAFGEDAWMGRGIPIMLSTTDRMMYNNEGTEVLLVWKL